MKTFEEYLKEAKMNKNSEYVDTNLKVYLKNLDEVKITGNYHNSKLDELEDFLTVGNFENSKVYDISGTKLEITYSTPLQSLIIRKKK